VISRQGGKVGKGGKGDKVVSSKRVNRCKGDNVISSKRGERIIIGVRGAKPVRTDFGGAFSAGPVADSRFSVSPRE